MATGLQRDLLDRFRLQMAETARGERFLALRKKRHWSQARAGLEVGVTEKTWRGWEHGGNIDWRNARRAAEVLEIDPEDLVIREDEPDGAPDGIREQLQKVLEGQALLASELRKVQDQLRHLRGVQRPTARKARASSK